MPMPASNAHTMASNSSMMIGLCPRTMAATTIRKAIRSNMPVSISLPLLGVSGGVVAPFVNYPRCCGVVSLFSKSFRHAAHRRIVFDHGKRIVKMVQQPFPFLVTGRAAKTHRVILDPVPVDQQDVAVGRLHAAAQFVRAVAAHRRDDALRLAKRVLELLFASGDHVQDGDFENHKFMTQDAGLSEKQQPGVSSTRRIGTY